MHVAWQRQSLEPAELGACEDPAHPDQLELGLADGQLVASWRWSWAGDRWHRLCAACDVHRWHTAAEAPDA